MSAVSKPTTTDGLNEEYYQITNEILGSFNKYRPPLNLFVFKEDVCRLAPYFKVGGRLSNEQIEELANLVNEGLVFVSREDHPVYVKHISYQLDLVLVDKNLKEGEIADIFTQALTRRLEEFYDQPVLAVFQKLWVDIMVLTEYLYNDIHRVKALIRRLHKEHTLANHSYNCGAVGLAVYGRLRGEDFENGGVKRKDFDRAAVGLFIHDMGMAKIPPFIRDKKGMLTPDEKTKVLQHPKLGFEMLAKLDAKFPEIEQCVVEHHERLTGQGYPQKKSGKSIGVFGRLCAVVDSFCAMTTKRPHAEAMEPHKAAASLSQDKGYDPNLTKHLQAMFLPKI